MPSYYAHHTSGLDTNPGTLAEPVKTLAKLITLVTNFGDTGYLYGGTWTEALVITRAGVTYDVYGDNGDAVLDVAGLNANGLYINKAGVTVRHIRPRNADSGRRNYYIDTGSTNVLLDEVRSYEGDQALFAFGAVGLVIQRMIIEGSETTAAASAAWFNNTTATVNYLLYKGSAGFPIRRIAVYGTTGSTVDINNAVCIGSNTDIFYVAPLSTLRIKNSFLGGDKLGTGYAINNAGGTVETEACLILPSWANQSLFSGAVSETDNIDPASVIPLPLFRHSQREGIVSINVDDWDLDYTIGLAALAETYGYRISFYGGVVGLLNESDYAAKLQALVHGGAYGLAGGHEVGSHSYSHPVLTNTSALTIRCTDASAVMTIAVTRVGTSDNWTSTLTTTTTAGGAPDLTLDLSAPGYDTIGELVAYIAAQTGYVCTINANINANTKSVCLAAVAGQSITSNYTALVDQSALFAVEISESKAWFETVIGGGYVCETFAYPGGQTNATVKAAVRDAGYTAARGDTTPPSSAFLLENVPMYGIYHYGPFDHYGSGTQAEIRRMAASWCVSFGAHGMIGAMVAHDATEMTLEQWGWLMDVFAQSDMQIMTIRAAADYIRTSGLWANAGGDQFYWARTFTDDSDYRLKPGSCLVDRGVSAGLSEDLDGNAVPRGGGVDIGPYEYTRNLLFNGPDSVVNSRSVIS